jgi:hypothetical protein
MPRMRAPAPRVAASAAHAARCRALTQTVASPFQVDALDRVLTRLALTEDGALEGVLAKLLPRVVDALKTPHPRARQARARTACRAAVP